MQPHSNTSLRQEIQDHQIDDATASAVISVIATQTSDDFERLATMGEVFVLLASHETEVDNKLAVLQAEVMALRKGNVQPMGRHNEVSQEPQPLNCTGLDDADRRLARRFEQHTGILRAHAESLSKLLAAHPWLHNDPIAARHAMKACSTLINTVLSAGTTPKLDGVEGKPWNR